MSATLSIISPVHCEGSSIIIFLDTIEQIIQPLGLSYEIILIDDGSTDNSWHYMQTEAKKRTCLRCLRLSRNFGKEAAVAAGIDAAEGDALIVLDSDLQHPPELIPEMIRLWENDEADIIEARKAERQKESFANKIFSTLFYKTYAFLTSSNLEGASDFKLIDRTAVEAWKQLGESKVFFRGMTSWLGFRHKAIPFTPPDRQTGKSKWSFFSKLQLALDSLSAYTAKPLSIIWILSLLFILFSCFVGGEALWSWWTNQASSGFTTVILITLVTGSAILASICILSVYIRQIFHETKARPRYLISERIGYMSTDFLPKNRGRNKKNNTLEQ